MPALIIRPARAADRSALARLYLASRRHAFHWLPADACALADFEAATAGEEILVAERDGELLGFASVWLPDSFLHHLFVAPGHLRQGVGRALLDACATLPGGCTTLKCLVRNTAALRFYAAQGWRAEAEGGAGDDAWLLLRKHGG